MKRKVQKGDPFFCTECGSALDDYWMCRESKEYAEVLKHHFECQRNGKFKGAMCSRLFIADGGAPGAAGRKSKLSAKKLANLKSSILRKIDADTTKKK